MSDVPYKYLKDENGNTFYPMTGSTSMVDPVSVVKGGTGADNAEDARDNLGVGDFKAGDTYTFDGALTVYGYFGSYSGTFYVYLPRNISPNITSVSASYSRFNWLMRSQQALSTANFSITDCNRAGGNVLFCNFTTEVHTTSYYQPCLINITNLSFTFS